MSPYLLVLGVAQDGGHPQPGCRRPCCTSGRPGHLPACLGIVDPASGGRWLVDATPALPQQLAALEAAAGPGLDGVLLTHAHIGHYTGLVWLGREAMSTRGLPLHTQPRMAAFLRDHAPWSQLVALGNVELRVADEVHLAPGLSARALRLPHRDELSETVAWRVQGPRRAALWLPDIDRWEDWEIPLEDALADVDLAFLDGTFWADGELGRDMAEVPHPRVRDTLARLAPLPARERAKVHFVHLNHTNPALDPGSPEAAAVATAGSAIAREGLRVEL